MKWFVPYCDFPDEARILALIYWFCVNVQSLFIEIKTEITHTLNTLYGDVLLSGKMYNRWSLCPWTLKMVFGPKHCGAEAKVRNNNGESWNDLNTEGSVQRQYVPAKGGAPANPSGTQWDSRQSRSSALSCAGSFSGKWSLTRSDFKVKLWHSHHIACADTLCYLSGEGTFVWVWWAPNTT